jgi:hypothetical protein
LSGGNVRFRAPLLVVSINLFVDHYKLVSIDAMIPIGRGQRELVIDRQTGKTSARGRYNH